MRQVRGVAVLHRVEIDDSAVRLGDGAGDGQGVDMEFEVAESVALAWLLATFPGFECSRSIRVRSSRVRVRASALGAKAPT